MKAIKISSKVRVSFGIRFFGIPNIYSRDSGFLTFWISGGSEFFRGMGYPVKKPPLIKDSQSIVLESMIIPTITFYNERKQYIG